MGDRVVAAVHKAARLAQEMSLVKSQAKEILEELVLHKVLMVVLAAAAGLILEEAQEALQPAGLVVREHRHQFLALQLLMLAVAVAVAVVQAQVLLAGLAVAAMAQRQTQTHHQPPQT